MGVSARLKILPFATNNWKHAGRAGVFELALAPRRSRARKWMSSGMERKGTRGPASYLLADELLAVGHGNAQVGLELLLDVLHGGLLQVRSLEDLVKALDDLAVLGAGGLLDGSLLGSHCSIPSRG